jgi:hypothetical protein
MEYALRKQIEGGDIHYHTRAFETSSELLGWCAKNSTWFVDFSHPTLHASDGIEFYFLLKKA